MSIYVKKTVVAQYQVYLKLKRDFVKKYQYPIKKYLFKNAS